MTSFLMSGVIMFERRFLSLLFLLISSSVSISAQDSTYSRFVYMVRIPATSHHRAILQTGFRMADRKGIITALHGVADGAAFSAFNKAGDVLNGLTVASVDVRNDMVLLRNHEIEDRPADGLRPSDGPLLGARELLRACGHPAGIDFYNKDVTTGEPVRKRLHELVPPDAAGAFDERGSPSMDIWVLNIQGNLVPGYSGAPLLNSSDQVVGIVNGGLLNGAAGISWAIPIDTIDWREIASART